MRFANQPITPRGLLGSQPMSVFTVLGFSSRQEYFRSNASRISLGRSFSRPNFTWSLWRKGSTKKTNKPWDLKSKSRSSVAKGTSSTLWQAPTGSHRDQNSWSRVGSRKTQGNQWRHREMLSPISSGSSAIWSRSPLLHVLAETRQLPPPNWRHRGEAGGGFFHRYKKGGEDNVSMFMGNPSLCYSISSINYTLISYIANSPGQRIVVSFLFNLYKVHRLVSFTNPPSNKSALRRALRSLWQPIINPEWWDGVGKIQKTCSNWKFVAASGVRSPACRTCAFASF